MANNDVSIVLNAVDNTRTAIQSAKSGLDSVKASAATVGSALAGLGAVGIAISFASTVKEAIDAADAINKLSQRTGVATEALSQLQFAAKLSDVSTESLTSGLKKLNLSIAEGLGGNAGKLEAFKSLGVDLKDASGQAITADKVLLKLADSFSTAKDGATKTAYAVALLGKAGDEMIPLLNGGGSAIEGMMKKADKLGLTIGADFAAQAEEFNDNLTILEMSSKRLAMSLGADLVAGLGKTMKAMAEASVEGGKLAGIVAGIQTLFTGDDQHKNNVAMVEQTDKMLTLEKYISQMRANGEKEDSPRLQARIAALAAVNAELKTTVAYRKILEGESVATEAAKPVQTKTLAPLKGAGAGGATASTFDTLQAALAKEQELADLELANGNKLSAYEKQRVDDIGKVADALKAGKISQAQASILNDAAMSASEARRAADAKATTAAYLEGVNEKISANQLELAANGELTEGQKMAAAWTTKLRDGKLDLLDAQKQSITAGLEELIALEKANALKKQQIKLGQDLIAAGQKSVGSLQEEIDKAKEYYDTIGMSKEQIAELTAKKAELSSAADDELAANMVLAASYAGDLHDAYLQYASDLTAVAAKKRELSKIKIDTAAKDTSAEEFKRVWESVDRTAHDTFVNIFNGGQDAFTKLRDTLKATLLDLLYQMTLRKWVFDITANITGGGSTIGSIGSAASSLSGSSGMLGNIGSTLSGYAGQFASGFSGSASAASAMMGGAELTTAASMGAMASAVMPWLLGAGVLKSLTGYSVSSDGSAMVANASSTGVSAVANRADYTQSSSGIFSGGTTHNSDWTEAGADVKTYFDTAVQTSTAAAKKYADALGLAPAAIDGFSKQIEVSITGLDAAGQQAAIDKAIGGFVDDMVTSAYGGALEAVAKTGETSGQTLERLAVSLGTVNASFDVLGRALLPVGVAGATTAAALAEVFGGLDKLQVSVGAYYQAFYSETERAAKGVGSLQEAFAGLGIAVPESKEAFRALVDSLDVTTDSGRSLYASVINLAPAFDQASQAAQAAANNMMAAISNWGSSSDLRGFQGQQLQQKLADGGLSLSMEEIMGASQASALAYYKTLDPSSRQAQTLLANQQAIFDFVGGAKQSAQSDNNSSSGSGGGGGSVVADSALSAWENATDSIVSAMKDLRVSLIDTGPDNFARLQSQFTIDVAKAQAGDLGAYEELQKLINPLVNAQKGISGSGIEETLFIANLYDTLDKLTTKVAGNSGGIPSIFDAGRYVINVGGRSIEDKALAEGADWANISGNTITQEMLAQYKLWVLQQSDAGALGARVVNPFSLPTFAVGTNRIPQDMLALVHKDEAIIPAAYNPAVGNAANSDELLLELRSLRAEVAALRQSSDQTAANTRKTATTLDDAAVGARPLTTIAA